MPLIASPIRSSIRSSPTYSPTVGAWGGGGPTASLVAALQASGAWDVLEFLDVYAVDSEAVAYTRVKGASSPAKVGTVTHTANRGVTGNGTTGYVNLNFNPGDGGSHIYLQNDAHFGFFSLTNSAATTFDMGSRVGSTTNSANVLARVSGDNANLKINENGAGNVIPNADSSGHFIARRSGASVEALFRNGALLGAPASVASVALANLNMYLGSLNANGTATTFSTRQYAVAHAGKAPTDAQVRAITAAVSDYLVSIGAYAPPAEGGYAIGDSIVAAYLSQNAVLDYVTTSQTKRSIAVPGNTITQQSAIWALDPNRSKSRWAIIQVGVNDLLVVADSAATIIARLQALVTSVGLLSQYQTKVLISQITPCRQRLIDLQGATDGEASYQKLLLINEAIAGAGGSPITGVDARITAHYALLSDGSGNLAASYEVAGTVDHIHPNNAGRQIIAAAWQDGLTSVGF